MKSCTYCGREHPDHATVCSIDGQPLRSTLPASPTPATNRAESMFGIVSFCIAIGAGALMLLTFVAAGILRSRGLQSGQYPGREFVGLAVIFSLAADLAAIGFGIAALCQQGKKKVFGILGLVFSSGIVVVAVGLIIIGLMYGSRSRH